LHGGAKFQAQLQFRGEMAFAAQVVFTQNLSERILAAAVNVDVSNLFKPDCIVAFGVGLC
jgi:hypothetical protein